MAAMSIWTPIIGPTRYIIGVLFHRARMRLRACLEGKGLEPVAMITCKQVSTLVSSGGLPAAPLTVRLGVRLHLAMCRHGRAFNASWTRSRVPPAR